MQTRNIIAWPAVLIVQGVDEMFLIESERDWLENIQMDTLRVNFDDQLMDSRGQLYHLSQNQPKASIEILATEESKSLSAFEALVKGHMISLNHCCTSKLKLTSYAEGIKLVGDTDQF